jgi:hypothetical protein
MRRARQPHLSGRLCLLASRPRARRTGPVETHRPRRPVNSQSPTVSA